MLWKLESCMQKKKRLDHYFTLYTKKLKNVNPETIKLLGWNSKLFYIGLGNLFLNVLQKQGQQKQNINKQKYIKQKKNSKGND